MPTSAPNKPPGKSMSDFGRGKGGIQRRGKKAARRALTHENAVFCGYSGAAQKMNATVGDQRRGFPGNLLDAIDGEGKGWKATGNSNKQGVNPRPKLLSLRGGGGPCRK